MFLDDPLLCLKAVGGISAIGVVISSVERLVTRQHFREDAMFSWAVHRTRDGHLFDSWLLPMYDKIFSYPGVLGIVVARFIGGLLVLVGLRWYPSFIAGCLVVALTSNLFSIRGSDGQSGADQESMIVFTALSVALMAPSRIVTQVACFFFAAQLMLAYGTSGWMKLPHTPWRDGSFLRGILRTRVYGHGFLFRLCDRHGFVSPFLSRAMLLFECLFPLTLLLPPPVAWSMAACAVAFHAGNALFMGLNGFFWSYVALVPAYIYTNMTLCAPVAGR